MDSGVIIAGIIFLPFYILLAITARWFASKYNRYERLVLKSIKKRAPSGESDKVVAATAEIVRDVLRGFKRN